MPTMLLSTLEDLNKMFQRRPVTTTGQGNLTRYGTVRAVILEASDALTAPGTVTGREIAYLIETDDGYLETWRHPRFIPARQLSDGANLIDDVQTGELTMEKFAEIVGVTLGLAEDLVKAHAKS